MTQRRRYSTDAAIEWGAAFSPVADPELDIFFFYLACKKNKRSFRISEGLKPIS